MNLERASELRISCGRGLVDLLVGELEALGHTPAKKWETGVDLPGTLRDACRLNLHLRTAYHVLFRLAAFSSRTADDLHREVTALPWEEWVDPDGYLSVVSRVDTPAITNSMYPNLKVKDAVVDRMIQQVGRRPSSGSDRSKLVLMLHWTGEEASLYLDTSGQKLSDRGYRKLPHSAPMRETLAAGVLLKAGYTGERPLVNPMCGSGTLAIEAALIGSGRAPGLLRSNYSVMHLLGFDHEAWQALRAEARQLRQGRKPAPIVASDSDPKAVAAARKNAATAGVDGLIRFQVCDFAETELPEPGEGIVLLNPEYGERMGQRQDLVETYARIGDFFKQRCGGWTGYVFTGSAPLRKKIGLRTSERTPFHNGEIECRLVRYELYAGTRKRKTEEPS